jgi:hypothetical protein
MTEASYKRKGSTLCSDPQANWVEIAKLFGYDAVAEKKLKIVKTYGKYIAGQTVKTESVTAIWPGCSERVSIETRRLVWLVLYKTPPTQAISCVDDKDSPAYGMYYVGTRQKFIRCLKEQDPSLPAEYLQEYAAKVVATQNLDTTLDKTAVETPKSVYVSKPAVEVPKPSTTEWALTSRSRGKCWKFSNRLTALSHLKVASAFTTDLELLELETV